MTFDEAKLSDSVICQECGYRPRPSRGPTARALVDGIEDQLSTLRADWVKTLKENLSTPEMREQIPLLPDADRKMVEDFLRRGKSPSPVDAAFVSALNQVLNRFEVRRVARDEIWSALFPEQAPATASELRGRFEAFLVDLGKGVSAEKLRILPEAEDSQ
jgi:hypothetical protein